MSENIGSTVWRGIAVAAVVWACSVVLVDAALAGCVRCDVCSGNGAPICTALDPGESQAISAFYRNVCIPAGCQSVDPVAEDCMTAFPGCAFLPQNAPAISKTGIAALALLLAGAGLWHRRRSQRVEAL